MSPILKYFIFISLIALPYLAASQAARSPYSSFGIGEPYGNALIHNQAMGGTGVSQPQYWFVNNQNPALLVFNYYTVFQVGALMESRTIKSDTSSTESVNGNMNYLVTAFPVKPGKWSTSVGLMPFTNINYKLQYNDVVQNSGGQDSIAVIEQGSGGLAQVYWSNGVRLHKNWAVGLKAAYVFGSAKTDYANTLLQTSQPVPYVIAVSEQIYAKDFRFTGGLSFSQDSIGKRHDYRVSAGLTYSFASNLNAEKTTYVQRRFINGNPTTSDTLEVMPGTVNVPATLTTGISISKGSKWSIGTEFTAQDWSQFKNLADDSENLGSTWRMSMGGEITPDILSDNILKRISYRMGLHYEKSPFLINNTELKDFGINFGFSMPAGRSSLDFAFSTGKRGDKSKNVLEETYFKAYFGITFNDQWFIRRRFD